MTPSGTTHEDFSRQEEVTGPSDRTFGLALAAALALLALWPIVRHRPLRAWLLPAAVVLAMLALVRPRLLAPANRAWLRLGLLLQRLVTPAVLVLLFCTVVIPSPLALPLLGKALLGLKRLRTADSCRSGRTAPGPAPDAMR